MNGTQKEMVRVTPMATDGLEHHFTIHSEGDNLAKGYTYDTKVEAARARAKAIKLFKSSGYIVLQ